MANNKHWDRNRESLRNNMKLFKTELSEISRLFQRIVLMGSEQDYATFKKLLTDFKNQLMRLVDDIESRR